MGDTMRQEGQRVTDEARNKAAEVAQQARQQVKHTLASQKDRAAGSLDGVVQALRTTGDQLETENQALGQVADGAAEMVERVSSYLRDRDLDDIARDVESVARRNPAMFIGGAFVLGFMAARFLKSSSSSGGNGGGYSGEYAGSYGAGYQGGGYQGAAGVYGREYANYGGDGGSGGYGGTSGGMTTGATTGTMTTTGTGASLGGTSTGMGSTGMGSTGLSGATGIGGMTSGGTGAGTTGSSGGYSSPYGAESSAPTSSATLMDDEDSDSTTG